MRFRYAFILTATVVPIVVAGCNKSPRDDDTPRAAVIKPGTYRVCDIGETGGHGAFTNEHVSIDDRVIIPTIDPLVTKVVFVPSNPQPGDPMERVVNMVGDRAKLATVQPFPHENSVSHATEYVDHYVSIAVNTAPQAEIGGCSISNNVLTILFCFEKTVDGAKKWGCADNLPHYGHIHVEN